MFCVESFTGNITFIPSNLVPRSKNGGGAGPVTFRQQTDTFYDNPLITGEVSNIFDENWQICGSLNEYLSQNLIFRD